MLKKWGLLVMVCTALIVAQAALPAVGSASDREGDLSVLINGKAVKLSAKPIMKDGSVYVPLRSLLVMLDANVDWDAKTGMITAQHNGTIVKLRVGSKHAAINGQPVALEKPPLLIGGTTYVSVRWLNETFGAIVKWQSRTRTVAIYYPEDELPRVGSYEGLQALLADVADRQSRVFGTAFDKSAVIEATDDNVPAAEPLSGENKSAADTSAEADYSGTNVQVQGVDEADIVKTDGEYLYQVNRHRIVITSAKPAEQMKIIATLRYADGSFAPQEIYVDSSRLIVIGSNRYFNTGESVDPAQPVPFNAENKMMILPIEPFVQSTAAIVYDITDISSPKEVRRLELEGGYLSSRKIGDSLYFISNKYLNMYGILKQTEAESTALPKVRDSAVHDKLTPVDYEDIRYFPDFVEPNYLLVAGVDLSGNEPMNVQTYLGSGSNVYASTDNLYVTVMRYEAQEAKDATNGDSETIGFAPVYGTPATAIYKFALDQGGVVYMAEGKVPGTVLNQFSMDEHDGYFRIATTSGEVWGSSGSSNNLYVLGDALQPIGQIQGIAPGERIYSVRFMGKRAYMVTFRTVDPLFVIDVADPAKPQILGSLKIPGYSDYLHPYDENHLIGFGKDTVEIPIKDAKGNVVSTNAYYLGMKAALFDVTDVANPKELHKVNIGDRGTGSELLYNHKALLFNKEKGLLAFPVELYEVKEGSWNEGGMPAYGTFVNQGAYVYQLDLAAGFRLRGIISHMTPEEIAKSGNYGYSDKFVHRTLYIGDTLYTLSDGMIKANAMDDLKELGSLNISE